VLLKPRYVIEKEGRLNLLGKKGRGSSLTQLRGENLPEKKGATKGKRKKRRTRAPVGGRGRKRRAGESRVSRGERRKQTGMDGAGGPLLGRGKKEATSGAYALLPIE